MTEASRVQAVDIQLGKAVASIEKLFVDSEEKDLVLARLREAQAQITYLEILPQKEATHFLQPITWA